jgi:hypothetical protein
MLFQGQFIRLAAIYDLWSPCPNSPKGILFAPPHVRSFIHLYTYT